MTQLLHPAEPFGEVNVHPQPDGSLAIVATVLMEPDIEGARCGLALDGSASMRSLYGDCGAVSPLLRHSGDNIVQPVARSLAAYLARFSATGTARLVYWSCGPDGGGVEEIADVGAGQAHALAIAGPRELPWGRQTRLLPPVRHFVENLFRDARWAFCVLVTDGRIDDLDAVKEFSWSLARDVAAGRRGPVKLVMLGLGRRVDESQLAQLDSLFEGSGLRGSDGEAVDLWDYKLAREMRHVQEVFAEVVSDDALVAPGGRVLDGEGHVAADFTAGLPARLRFTLPAGSTAFTLELQGHRIVQELGGAFSPARA